MAAQRELRPIRIGQGQLVQDGRLSSEIQSYRDQASGGPVDLHGLQLGMRALHQLFILQVGRDAEVPYLLPEKSTQSTKDAPKLECSEDDRVE